MLRVLRLLPMLVGTTVYGQVVINEVDYDQPSTDATEYLEVKNTGTSSYPLQYLQVVMVNGNAGGAALYRTLENASWPALDAQDYFVICTNQASTANCDVQVTPATNLIQNGVPDAIALVFIGGTEPMIVDALSYGGSVPGYTEGSGTPQQDSNEVPGRSIGRWPDGSDSDDNATDFRVMCSTPGATNSIDPADCDLTTGIASSAFLPATFTVLPAPGGAQIMLYYADHSGQQVTFDVFDADGSLLATRAMQGQRASWTFDASVWRGQLLLVRATAANRQEVRRIILP